MALIKTLVLVPMRDNQGPRFEQAEWEALEDRLLQFGGFTRLPGAVGVWSMAGRIFRDPSFQYVVSLQNWRELSAWIEVIDWALAAFRQEALYIEAAGLPDILAALP